MPKKLGIEGLWTSSLYWLYCMLSLPFYFDNIKVSRSCDLQAFATGRLKLGGNIMLSQKLSALFPANKAKLWTINHFKDDNVETIEWVLWLKFWPVFFFLKIVTCNY